MKKVSIDFNTPKSKESSLYKLLQNKISDEILGFSGFVDEKDRPQGECKIGFVDEEGIYQILCANFFEGNLIGSAILTEQNDEAKGYIKSVEFNFMSDPYGEIFFNDGAHYIGGLHKTFPDGRGKLTEANGDYQIGFYKDGMMHGLVIDYDKNNNIAYKSVYLEGECIISSENDEEILKALEDCGFNYKNFLKIHGKNNEEKQDNFKLEKVKEGINKIEENIVGQRNAVKIITNNLLLSMLCALQDNKPITSMVFTGPTGVGKTEMAKQISQNIFGKEPFVVDYANFHDDFMLSSLIGSPAGYSGSKEEPQFLKYVRENAETGGVLLFEEIDKADEKCLNFFMRMLDEAEVLDAHNRSYKVNNFIILATTNMTANTSRKLGFSNRDDDVKEQMAKTEFTGMKKEQLARFGLVVEFSTFNKTEKRQLTLKALEKAVKRIKTIKNYDIKIKFEDKFVDDLVSKINDSFGVRDIQTRAANTINEKLAEFIRKNDAKKIIVNFKSLEDVEIFDKNKKLIDEKTF